MRVSFLSKLVLSAAALLLVACSTDIEVKRTKHAPIDDKPAAAPASK